MQNTAVGSSASISSHVAARVSRVTYRARSTRHPRHPKQPPSHMTSSRSTLLTLHDGLAPPRGTFCAELCSLGARAWRSRGLKSGTKRERVGKGRRGRGAQRAAGNKSQAWALREELHSVALLQSIPICPALLLRHSAQRTCHEGR